MGREAGEAAQFNLLISSVDPNLQAGSEGKPQRGWLAAEAENPFLIPNEAVNVCVPYGKEVWG